MEIGGLHLTYGTVAIFAVAVFLLAGVYSFVKQGLKVADATAFSLCMANRMPIIVFNLLTEGNIARAVAGERIGTLVSTPAPDPGVRLRSPREQP